jgi:lysophospholipase L1-like esterase
MHQAAGSVVARLVRKPGQGNPATIVGGSVMNAWGLGDCEGGSNVRSSLYGNSDLADAGTGIAWGIVQSAGGSWQAGAHASCVDGYTVGTSTDATALASTGSYGVGCSPGFPGVALNGWLLRYDFYATKLTNAQLQTACALPAPTNIGAALPRGADLLRYTNKIIDISPTTADIAPSFTGAFSFFDSIFYDTNPPDKTPYFNAGSELGIPMGKQILSQNRSSLHGNLQYMAGINGFYVEWDVRLSGNDPDHFPAVWVMPQEHNAAQTDAYGALDPVGGADPAGYERWMELDVDEGGFGPSTTSSVIDWQGTFDNANGQYWRDFPTDTVPGNGITNKIGKGWIDRTQKHTFGASYDPRHNVVRWYLDNVEIFKAQTGVPTIAPFQNFYVITGAQTFGGNVPYTMYLSRIRAYTVPRLLGYGDSLMAGTGASSPATAWFYLLSVALTRGLIDRGVGGTGSTAIAASVVNFGFEATANDIVIIEGGYNDFPWAAGTVESNIATAVASLPAGTKYLVMGIPTSELAAPYVGGLYTGGTYRPAVDTINSNNAATYGSRFVDINAYLIANGLSSQGITPTTQDTIDLGHGIVPSSLRNDLVHWNDAGHKAVEGKMLSVIQGLGW